jgi:uncharacterized protein (DUF1330 family)
MSKAYVISEVVIEDAVRGEEYRERAAESIAAHGGRYLVRGAEAQVLEGAQERRPEERVVVVEFDSVEVARRWYDSPEYAPARTLAENGALTRRLTLVEGYGVRS